MVIAFSFCIYNPPNPRYYRGLLGNIDLIHKHFPDAYIYIYVGNDVPDSYVIELSTRKNTVLRFTYHVGARNMIDRFFAIDEPDVDIMFVRDADSRVHWKDRWAIREFLNQPQFVAHTIRDNIQHTADMMGGLWGIRKTSGLNMTSEYATYNEDPEKGHRLGHDQNFLSDMIYPKVVSRMLVHYSNQRRKVGETAVEFPFDWINDVYCGRIETDYVDRPEPPKKPSASWRDPLSAITISQPTSLPPIVKFLNKK